MTATDFMELIGREERLRDDLLPFVKDGPLGQMFHHKYFIEIMHRPEHAGLTNFKVDFTEKRVKEARAKKQWSRFIYLHERPYRLEAFLEIADELRPRDYWKLVGGIWQDSENIWQCRDYWDEIFSRDDPMRGLMMDRSERSALAKLPDKLTIYRGDKTANRARKGLSWTLDRSRAQWFAKRLCKKGDTAFVAKGKIAKKDVIAYLTGRNESEIIASPLNIRIERIDRA